MKNKTKFIIGMAAFVTLGSVGIAGCGDKEKETPQTPAATQYTVTVQNGEGTTTQVKVKSGTLIGTIIKPVKAYHTFEGWYMGSVFTENSKLSDSDVITRDMTIYANYTKNAIPVINFKILDSDGTTTLIDTANIGRDLVLSYDNYAPDVIEKESPNDPETSIYFQGWKFASGSDETLYRPGDTITTVSGDLIPYYATDESVNENIEYFTFTDTESTGTWTITQVSEGASSEIEVPALYQGKPVVSIASTSTGTSAVPVFLGTVTSITLPNTLTHLGHSAFAMTSISELTIPNSVTSLGVATFTDCPLLSFTIPRSVTNIHNYTFGNYYSCMLQVTNLSNIDLSSDFSSDTYEYRTDTTIPFHGSFSQVDGLVIFTYNEKVIACDYVGSATSVTLPDSITEIGSRAFSGCSTLTSITIPNSVTSIGHYAFHDCEGLTNITIPNSLTTIGWRAFYDCENLTTVSYAGTANEWDNTGFESELPAVATVYYYHSIVRDATGRVLASLTDEERSIDSPDNPGTPLYFQGWKFESGTDTTLYKPGDVVISTEGTGSLTPFYATDESLNPNIAYFTFTDPNSMNEWSLLSVASEAPQELEIPSLYKGKLVTSIQAHAQGSSISMLFMNTLTSIRLPKTINNLGVGAFRFCRTLTSIILSSNIKTIGKEAFFNTGLTTINYTGTEDQWNAIDIDINGNDDLTNTTINYNYESHEIIYNLDEGSNNIANPALYNESNNTFLKDPTKFGYGFGGWYDNEEYTGDPIVLIPSGSTGDKTLYAKFTPINYEIIYHLNDGEAVATNPTSYNITTETITLSESTKDGYTFAGWYDNAEFTGNAITTIELGSTGNKSLYAKFLPIYYDITYDLNEGTNAAGNPDEYNIDQEITLLAPRKTGHVFVGWYDNANYAGKTIEHIFKGSKGDISLYAKFAVPTEPIEETNSEGLIFSLNPDGESYSVIGYVGDRGVINIDETYNGKPVTNIDAMTFYNDINNGYITKINLPNNLKTVDMLAFGDPGSYNGYVTLNNMNYLGNETNPYLYLLGVSDNSLSTYTIHEDCQIIGYTAFAECTSLAGVTIPERVTSIGAAAFQNCSALESIQIPNNVTSIGIMAFEGAGLTGTEDTTGHGIYVGSEDNDYLCLIGGSEETTNLQIHAQCKFVTLSLSMLPQENFTCSVDSDNESLHMTDGYLIETETKTLLSAFTTNDPIPDDGSVTSIGSYAFMGCASLESITIPDSVTNIGAGAFTDCDSLTSITIGSGVTNIGANAFENCTGLTSITIPNSVTNIGASAFLGCTSLAEIIIPDDGSVTSIGSYAFDGCTSLTEFVIPDTVTEIGSYAFCNCTSLENISIGNGVRYIGRYVFDGCGEFTSISTYNNLAYLGNETNPYLYLYYPTDDTLETYTIHENCRLIATEAFSGYTNLTEIVIPDSVISIGAGAFDSCEGLTSITIGSGVKSIGSYAFYYCTSLTEIVIPDSVISIGEGAFQECYGLESITIGSGVTSISRYAFDSCEGLTSITIGSSVTNIGAGAFYDCTSLTEIVIPDSVTSIGAAAFYGCEGLTSITIGSDVTSIGASAFNGCASLTEFVIPDSVTSIGERALCETINLETLIVDEENQFFHSEGNCLIHTESNVLIQGTKASVIPDDGSVTSIGSYAFSGCSDLTEIIIPDSVTSIGSYAFSGCSDLTEIIIPDSVISIGNSAFYRCTGLTEIIIPDSVTSIVTQAFGSCEGLTSITIGSGVTSIGDSAFSYCVGLTSISIGSGVTSIGERAFIGCTSLTEIVIPDSVISIGNSAFNGCTSLTEIVIPDSVTSIGERAFYGCTALTTINYTGTEEEWNGITKGTNATPAGVNIVYNYVPEE